MGLLAKPRQERRKTWDVLGFCGGNLTQQKAMGAEGCKLSVAMASAPVLMVPRFPLAGSLPGAEGADGR